MLRMNWFVYLVAHIFSVLDKVWVAVYWWASTTAQATWPSSSPYYSLSFHVRVLSFVIRCFCLSLKMVLSEEPRKLIVSQHQHRKTPSQLFDIMKDFCSRSTIYNTISSSENDHSKPKPYKARRKSISWTLKDNRVIETWQQLISKVWLGSKRRKNRNAQETRNKSLHKTDP